MVELKMLRRALFENCGSKRPETLAHFDEGVDTIPHIPYTRISKDRSRAEGTRAKLHAALKPTDDLAHCKAVGDGVQQKLFAPTKIRVRNGNSREQSGDGVAGVLRTEIGVAHRLTGQAAEAAGMSECGGPARTSGIPRRRLNEKSLEWAVAQDS